jgi:prepilin-type N-terminal cleavage/methylation domain-containing protein
VSRLTAALGRVRDRDGQRGFTLVELLVASMMFLVLSTALFTTVLTGTAQVKNGREYNDLNEEARVLLNRMSRELREAQDVTAVTNPGAAVNGSGTPLYSGYYAQAAADSSVTFQVDFDGDGTVEATATDPEVLTYKYDRANRRVLLLASGQTLPVLAGNVESFTYRFTSRLYQADGSVDGTRDGVVNWEELDADSVTAKGNGNHVLDPQELEFVDSITIEITVLKGARQQTYRTQVDLRNRPY